MFILKMREHASLLVLRGVAGDVAVGLCELIVRAFFASQMGPFKSVGDGFQHQLGAHSTISTKPFCARGGPI